MVAIPLKPIRPLWGLIGKAQPTKVSQTVQNSGAVSNRRDLQAALRGNNRISDSGLFIRTEAGGCIEKENALNLALRTERPVDRIITGAARAQMITCQNHTRKVVGSRPPEKSSTEMRKKGVKSGGGGTYRLK